MEGHFHLIRGTHCVFVIFENQGVSLVCRSAVEVEQPSRLVADARIRMAVHRPSYLSAACPINVIHDR